MVNQTEEVFGSVNPTKQVGIGSVSSARQRGAMGSISPTDATNALDVLAEENPTTQFDQPTEKETKFSKSTTPKKLTPEGLSPPVEPVTPEMEDIAEEAVSEINQSVPPTNSLRPQARPDRKLQSAIKKIIELGYVQRREARNKTEEEVLKGFDSTFRTITNLTESKNLKTITKFITQALGAEDPNLDVTKEGVYWCAAFVNHILTEMGADTLGKGDKYNRLRARKYANYGKEVSLEDMQEGDILLFGYEDGISHVGFYTGERSGNTVNMMGGNQFSGVMDAQDNPIYEVNSVPRNLRNIVGVRRVTFDGDSSRIASDQKVADPIFRYFDTPNYEAKFNPSSNKRYAQGGVVDMNNQMEMLFDEGGIADDGMRRDPVSGNEIPPGSLAEEVRDDIPAQLSEGEYVVPADVVRFFGVKYFEDLRMEAKMGLSNMEANGRIGGEPIGPSGMEVGPSGMEENPLTPEEMAVLEQMGMAVGGFVPEQEPPQAVGNSVQGFAPGGDVQPTTNYGDTAAGLPSWAAIPGASYMPQEWQEENLPSTTSYKPVQTITTADSTPTTTTTTDTATDIVTATTGKEACEKMGMMFDEATQQCILKQDSSTSDDPTVTPTTGKSQVFKFKEPDVDYFNMSDEDLAKVGLETSNKFEDKMGKIGAAALLGGAGLAAFGLFDSARQGSTIAEVRSAALVAAAKGNTALADTLNARAKELVGKSSLLVQGADYFGALSGMNDFAQQIAAFAPINFKINKELFGDNEAAYQRAVMASVTPKDDGLGKTAETRAAQKVLSNKNSFEELSKTDRPETWEGQTKEVGGVKVKQFQPAKTAAEIQKSKNDDKDSPAQAAAKNKAKAEAAASRLGVNLATGGRYKGGLMAKRKKKK